VLLELDDIFVPDLDICGAIGMADANELSLDIDDVGVETT
jgi:hypothetical protein